MQSLNGVICFRTKNSRQLKAFLRPIKEFAYLAILSLLTFGSYSDAVPTVPTVPTDPKLNLSPSSCRFDGKSGRFTDSQGASLKLAFELHGEPTTTLEFIEKFFSKKIKANDISRLSKAHEHSSPQMVIRYQDLRKSLKLNTPIWLALELPSDAALANSTKDFEKTFMQMEQGILRLTNSKDATLKTLLIVFGPQVVAYMHDKLSLKSFKNREPAKIVGVDNQRSNNDEKLEQKQSKAKASLIQAHHEFITLIQSGDNEAALWNHTDRKLKGLNVYSEPHLAIEILSQIEKDPLFRSAGAGAKLKFLRFKGNIKNLSEVKSLSEKENSREMSARDNGIARELLISMREHDGEGYAVFGSAHREGVLRELFQQCNQGTKPLGRHLMGSR